MNLEAGGNVPCAWPSAGLSLDGFDFENLTGEPFTSAALIDPVSDATSAVASVGLTESAPVLAPRDVLPPQSSTVGDWVKLERVFSDADDSASSADDDDASPSSVSPASTPLVPDDVLSHADSSSFGQPPAPDLLSQLVSRTSDLQKTESVLSLHPLTKCEAAIASVVPVGEAGAPAKGIRPLAAVEGESSLEIANGGVKDSASLSSVSPVDGDEKKDPMGSAEDVPSDSDGCLEDDSDDLDDEEIRLADTRINDLLVEARENANRQKLELREKLKRELAEQQSTLDPEMRGKLRSRREAAVSRLNKNAYSTQLEHAIRKVVLENMKLRREDGRSKRRRRVR